ncbi:MAG: hypothetical protein ACREQ5_34165, partial [Candidatus Dormibacteria bacterium]
GVEGGPPSPCRGSPPLMSSESRGSGGDEVGAIPASGANAGPGRAPASEQERTPPGWVALPVLRPPTRRSLADGRRDAAVRRCVDALEAACVPGGGEGVPPSRRTGCGGGAPSRRQLAPRGEEGRKVVDEPQVAGVVVIEHRGQADAVLLRGGDGGLRHATMGGRVRGGEQGEGRACLRAVLLRLCGEQALEATGALGFAGDDVPRGARDPTECQQGRAGWARSVARRR